MISSSYHQYSKIIKFTKLMTIFWILWALCDLGVFKNDVGLFKLAQKFQNFENSQIKWQNSQIGTFQNLLWFLEQNTINNLGVFKWFVGLFASDLGLFKFLGTFWKVLEICEKSQIILKSPKLDAKSPKLWTQFDGSYHRKKGVI